MKLEDDEFWQQIFKEIQINYESIDIFLKINFLWVIASKSDVIIYKDKKLNNLIQSINEEISQTDNKIRL
jgi:hypothetical protein